MTEQSFDELIRGASSEAPTEDSNEELSADAPDEAEDVVGNLAVFPDEPPKSGEWVDVHDVLGEPTEDEIEQGRALGESIDTDDDDDGGEQ